MKHSAMAIRVGIALVALGVLGWSALGLGQTSAGRTCSSGYACSETPWRFVRPERRVKVVVLAGSIGAFQDQPYARHFYDWCPNVEIRNLSVVGMGAMQLFQRFQTEVLRNRAYPFGQEGLEHWLVWNGGLNSSASAVRTNRYIRRSFVEAHRRGMRSVGMTLSPWGTLEDPRFRASRGLDTFRNTRRIVDFVLGTVSPADALGSFVSERAHPTGPWEPDELADVRIDLFDAASLRNATAPVRDAATVRRELDRDGRWRSQIDRLPETERATRVASDVEVLGQLERFFLRPELRGFDPIHPNRDGHRAIAALACPSLPASWGCQCPR